MLIFRIILGILFSCYLIGQDSSSKAIVLPVLNFNYQEIDSILIGELKTSDKFGNYYSLNEVTENAAVYRLHEVPVFVDTLIVKYSSHPMLKKTVEKQIFTQLWNCPPGQTFDRKLKQTGQYYSFLPGKIDYSYFSSEHEKIGVILFLEPEFISYFSGLAGANRGSTDKWTATGEINIHIENLWQTAGIIDIKWKRPDSLSQSIGIEFSEPHPFGWPVGIGGKYLQDLWNGLYIKSEISLFSNVRSGKIGNIKIGYRNRKISPTENGLNGGITFSKTKYLTLAASGDSRNDLWLPDYGKYWQIETAWGRRTGTTKNDVGTLSAGFVQYYKLNRSFLGKVRFLTENIWQSKNEIGQGDLYHYGGSNTLRGYMENQFSVPWYALGSTEVHYKASKNSRIFIFTDFSVHGESIVWNRSYGAGYIQKTGKVILELAYGLGAEDTFKSGKVHFQFLTYF